MKYKCLHHKAVFSTVGDNQAPEYEVHSCSTAQSFRKSYRKGCKHFLNTWFKRKGRRNFIVCDISVYLEVVSYKRADEYRGIYEIVSFCDDHINTII